MARVPPRAGPASARALQDRGLLLGRGRGRGLVSLVPVALEGEEAGPWAAPVPPGVVALLLVGGQEGLREVARQGPGAQAGPVRQACALVAPVPWGRDWAPGCAAARKQLIARLPPAPGPSGGARDKGSPDEAGGVPEAGPGEVPGAAVAADRAAAAERVVVGTTARS